MSDNKKSTGQQDRIRVDANDSAEVEYLHQQYPSYTHAQILEAVKKYGPMRSNIERHLSSKNSEGK
jgi:hypothetical protein